MFGTVVDMPGTDQQDLQSFDVIVIGGSAAGLSAALALGRSRRSVLVIDAGAPRNAPAAHMHGVLGHDGLPPSEFVALGRAEVARYGVELVEGVAVDARRGDDESFEVDLADGTTRRARRLVVATGATDELPEITNLRSRWGADVIHCPYCHGWEVRDTRIAVISTGPMGVHQATLFRQWSDDVTLIVHTGPLPTPDQVRRLGARGVRIVEGIVREVDVADDRITGVCLDDDTRLDVDTVVVGPRVVAHSPVLDALGVARVPSPRGEEFALGYEVDPMGQTSVAGVWAAGNVVDAFATVPAAVASGYQTGAVLNADLIEDDTDRVLAALTSHDHPHSHEHSHDHSRADGHVHGGLLHADDLADDVEPPVFDQAFWDSRYEAADQIWSGNANPQLVAEVADLRPGRALDVGAGEGADAIWLAERGWTVEAVDISPVALERGRRQAEPLGPEIAGRITWRAADVLTDPLGPDTYDLVSLQFMQFDLAERTGLFERAVAAVAPGGTLLIVGHHPSVLHGGLGPEHMAERFYTADEIVELLDDDWTVVTAEARPRTMNVEGAETTIHDTVLHAQRR